MFFAREWGALPFIFLCFSFTFNYWLSGFVMTFHLEIVCHADVDHYDHPEYAEMAARNCNERRETRQQAIQELRSMIISRGLCHPRRMDDAHLLKFLRSRWFIPALAHKLVVRYEDFRKQHPTLYDCNLFELSKVTDVIAGTLPESPYCGRVMLLRFGRLDTDKFSLVDFVRACLAMGEITSLVPRLQVMGTSLVVDLEGLVWRQLSYFTPTFAHYLVSLMGVNFPFLVHGIHFVNYDWTLTSLLFIAKRFIPQAAFKYIHFHGNDMSSLHRHIEPESLPKEYGGHCKQVVTFEEWLPCMKKYITGDENLVRELTDLGYKGVHYRKLETNKPFRT